MWELIRANKRRSVVLFFSMGICLVFLGYLVGNVFFPPDGGIAGVVLALLIWLVLSLVSYVSGDSILLAVSGAKEVTADIHPQFFHVVEEMKLAANLPVMPKVYIIDEAAPNAFATGIRPEKSSVAVTAGLLSRLNRDELQGVVAHEMSHIVNRDVLFVTFAGVMLGSIVLISEVFLRSLWYSGGSSGRYRSSKKAGGQAGLPLFALAILFAILAPILTRLLYFAISRRREYLADATAARLTRYPEGLASALEKIASTNLELPSANKVTAPMYIVNPLRKEGTALSNLTSTHPPLQERIAILRSMMYRANFLDYQKAFSRVKGDKSGIIPSSGLQQTDVVAIREPSPEQFPKLDEKKGHRELGDLLRAVNKYAFLTCACGLKIKIPPDFRKSQISCPRCGRQHQIPFAEVAAMAAAAEGVTVDKGQDGTDGEPSQLRVYLRKGNGWESFPCSCGRMLQISPAFASSHIACPSCGKRTLIQNRPS